MADRTEELRSLLQQLLQRDTRPEWQTWARLEQVRWLIRADREGVGQNLAGK